MKTRGFTLIELLVVLAIIGILASVVLSSLDDARTAARDTIRVQDMRSIRTALEQFANDHGGTYPSLNNSGVPSTGQIIGVGNPIDDALRPYLDPVPRDPRHDAGTGSAPVAGALYFYSYDPNHRVSLSDCDGNINSPPWPSDSIAAPVFGFNRAEALTNLRKDTCWGFQMNLANADYNQSLY